MENPLAEEIKQSWLDKPVFSFLPKFKIEHLIIAILLLLAVISRFYNVGQRDMSHDEVNHVVPSYSLYQGNGYQHDPVTHGPMQFHLIAATYFLFGDSDTSSRIPSVLFSIATIAFVIFAFKRYLGRIGSLLAGLFFLISPYMLFYGRYTRNESFVALFGVITLFSVLYYLEKGKNSTLLIYTAVLSLQFCTKETSYIYTAIMLIFLAILFLLDVLKMEWAQNLKKRLFSYGMIAAFLLAGLALIASAMEAKASSTNQPFTNQLLQSWLPLYHTVLLLSLGLAVIAVLFAFFNLLRGLGWSAVKNLRSFDLLILTIILVLPLLTAFPIKLLGWDPLDYSQAGLIHTSIVLIIMTLIAIVLGLAWKPKLFLSNAGLFYAIFTVLYTTFFTNGQGFFTGIVGSLGYWLSQQSFARGTQPWYYYAFLQIPMYEYLGALGLILATVYASRHKLFSTRPGISPAAQVLEEPESTSQLLLPIPEDKCTDCSEETPTKLPVMALLAFWSVMNLIAYSVAGEKMPWITVHIALPMLLAAGWGVGYLVETVPWKKLLNQRGLLTVLLIPVFLVSLFSTIGTLIGPNRPFAGMELAQLQITSTFLFSLIALIFSGWGILRLLSNWAGKDILRLVLVTFFGFLTILTARSAYQANYINYDTAKEFLVYAHGAAGPKQVLGQVEEISNRITGGKDIKVAYIGDALYPYWWYFRDYPNKIWYKDQITRELLNYPLVITDDAYLSQTKSVLGNNYIQYDYKRLWWPMMDYTNLTVERVWDAVKNPQMLEALFNIWFNKDYTLYATLNNNANLTLETWQPSASIHFFIKKDIVAEIWNYGSVPSTATTTQVDPYAGKYVNLTPDMFIGQAGTGEGQFASAHGIAIAPDGTVYIADSNNNRIQHFSAAGQFLNAWGIAGSMDSGNAPGGTFKEPWGIAVGPDGSVYVADTWNFRIQKFTTDGKFVTMWGIAGQAETPTSFWGPRGVAVDKQGHVYITDTGNKRVVVFDKDGNFITQFGSTGMDNGQFDEPVGIAVDSAGLVYVADTWNKRIQVFLPDETGINFTYLRSWDVAGWDSQSTDNKPFLALDSKDNVYVTDPDNYRVLEFDNSGQFLRGWGQYSSGLDGFGKPIGLAIDVSDHVWVVDSGNSFLLRFTLPTIASEQVTSLPPFPSSPIALTFDTNSNQLVDSLGQAYYQLDSTRNLWVPIVPNSIAQSFTELVTPLQDKTGIWYLKSTDGTALYQWNEGALLWISLQIEATATK